MMRLHAKLPSREQRDPFIARLTTDPLLPKALRSTEALVLDVDRPIDKAGYQAVFVRDGTGADSDNFALPPELRYLGSGDVVRVNPRTAEIHVLYRRSSPHNSLLVTERCNSKCLMCSQPPRAVDDGYIVEDLLKAIPLMSPETEVIGFTGGEPTLLHDGFIALLNCAKSYLPDTAVHVLTNGRLLSYLAYAQKVAVVQHPQLMLCIPLYSDVDSLHDFVVQARGAFEQTVRGILNLGRVGIAVEIRVVIHQQTYARLPQLAEFIARNLPFVSHVALMGLEMTGFTRANLEALWIDPVDYQRELSEAMATLHWAGLHTSIYNHQLCLLPSELWGFARKSISDWKNIYMPECEGCTVNEQCGGFFASAEHRHSDYIQPVGTSGEVVSLNSFHLS
jgi:His-Xaa-Ser system radical SAM maturase HxsC